MGSPLLFPTDHYHQKLQEKPIFFDSEFPLYFGARGAWQIQRYADVKRVLEDYEVFSNSYLPKTDVLGFNFNQEDPPRHKKLRALISQAFSRSAVFGMNEWLYKLCEERLLKKIETGAMDFACDFALSLPIEVITRLLGVPEQSHEKIDSWAKAVLGNPAKAGGMEVYISSLQEMNVYFNQLVQERGSLHSNDIISSLLTAEVDGERLQINEIVGTCITLLLAGHETTSALLTNAMFTFIQFPQVQEALALLPGSIPAALNEAQRLHPSVLSMYRIATRDIELSGNEIKKGDYINAWLASANRDPSVFDNPDTFNINRNNHHLHLSFGHGIHYCIGAPLARMQAKIAFEIIFKLIRHVRLLPEATLSRNESLIVSSLKSLPIIFEVI